MFLLYFIQVGLGLYNYNMSAALLANISKRQDLDVIRYATRILMSSNVL